jgi:AcrR family transcriptional regulator
MSGAVKGAARRGAAHRAFRRAELVDAAVRAIRRHGAGVTVAQIAAEAGVTKPVLYRHFTDRADLQRAVSEHAAELLIGRVAPALASDAAPAEHVRGVIDEFLATLEEQPELWRFVVHNPLEREPSAEVVEEGRQLVARMLAGVLSERLRGLGMPADGAEPWAFGLVGMVQSAGDWWLEHRTMSRAVLADHLSTLIWQGLGGIVGDPDGGQPPTANPTRPAAAGAIST